MKHTAIIVMLSCLLNPLFSQDVNNKIEYDQEDLEFLFNSIGLNVYKFPFTSNSNESLNIIIEEYRNGQLVQTIDFYQQFLPMFKILKKSPKDFFQPLDDDESSWVKFYVSNLQGKLQTTIRTGMIEKKYDFDISDLRFTQSRTFDYVQTELSERQALFVFYGINDGKLLTCPGDASIGDILPMYNHVVVFYAEPFVIF